MTFSLYCYLLVKERSDEILETIKLIQEKLNQVDNIAIRSRYEFMMVEWLVFTVDNITWDIGIQLHEVIEATNVPVLFIGSSGSGLSDTNQLKSGKFDAYIKSLFLTPETVDELVSYFMHQTKILDYCLQLWQRQLLEIIDILDIEELQYRINYAPLKSMIQQRLVDLQPQTVDPDQSGLDQFF